MEKIIFDCEVVTPMFLAGAKENEFELRAPSLKGALRFWWRAMHGNKDLEELKKNETEIFGGGGDNARKSGFSIKIYKDDSYFAFTKNNFPSEKNMINVNINGREVPINILHYVGYGVNEYIRGKGQIIIRNYLASKSKFKIELSFNSLINDTQKQEVIDALFLTSLIGGIGSRSRNGFGKFLVNNSNYNEQYMVSLIKKFNYNKSLWTSFSDETKIFKYDEDFPSWDRALAEISKVYRSVRTGLERPHQFNKRQRISAPIMDGRIQVSDLDRHSKPLFITVIKDLNNEQYYSYIILMPYMYLNTFISENKNINQNKLVQMRQEFDNVMNLLNSSLSSLNEINLL